MPERQRRPIVAQSVLACLGLVLVAVVAAIGLAWTADAAWLRVVLVAAIVLVGTAHGSSVVAVAFRIADPPRPRTIDLPGGPPSRRGDDLQPPPGTMRGGAMIGVLERAATIVALASGQPGAIAVVVAVKAIGRFGELDGPVMRERFLVGSLASISTSAAWGLVARLLVA